MSLLSLPEDQQERLKNDDPAIRNLSIRDAIQAGSAHERWKIMIHQLDNAESWSHQIRKGDNQSTIARREGITRARVCQLLRLNDLSHSQKKLMRQGDQKYYGISIKELLSLL